MASRYLSPLMPLDARVKHAGEVFGGTDETDGISGISGSLGKKRRAREQNHAVEGYRRGLLHTENELRGISV